MHVSWVLKQGSTCNGIQLYRSADTTNFVQIYEIEGVCGSSSAPVLYSYDDNSPIPNSWNHYRLSLGAQGVSTIASVEFYEYNERGFLLFPNPVKDMAQLRLENPKNEQFAFCLINHNGSEIYKVGSRSASELPLDLRLIPPGTYSFKVLFESGKVMSGSLVKVE